MRKRRPHMRASDRETRFLHPDTGIQKDFRAIYKTPASFFQKKTGKTASSISSARPNTVCIIGAALGDEGKGRIIDNMVGAFLTKPGIKKVVVVRFQGGNNSGHTVEVKGKTLALHQVPCSVMYKQTVGIIDRGMTINPEDLTTEIHIVEALAGSTKGKLFLSPDAVLNTDLERAEELLNRKKQGKAAGGTGRGIAPSYAHHYDRLGFHIADVIADTWKETLGAQYDRYEKEFALYDMKLAEVMVPDFAKMKQTKKEQKRAVGSKRIFLQRIGKARDEIINRRMVTNTFLLHQQTYQDTSAAVLFEGAQAVGLNAWVGTLPDITASDTTAYGIQAGTAFWRVSDVEKRIGVFKVPYTSSVGARRMPTHAEDAWSVRVRDEAHEYGTTTGRPRDILYLDLPLLSYAVHMGGIDSLAGTHLDTAWENIPIQVCTHYTNKKGDMVPYQPGLSYLKDVVPHYITLPGWDGEKVRKARSVKALPDNAKKFLAFIEKRLATPIVAVTTGPGREHYLTLQ